MSRKTKKKKKHALRSSERKRLTARLQQMVADSPKLGKAVIQVIEQDEYILYVDGSNEPLAFQLSDVDDSIIIPTLKLIRSGNNQLPTVSVDVGAIRFVTNGADVMAPGIRAFSHDVQENDLVVVVEERGSTPICVGTMIRSRQDIEESSRGKAIRNLHHLKDNIWDFEER